MNITITFTDGLTLDYLEMEDFKFEDGVFTLRFYQDGSLQERSFEMAEIERLSAH